MMACELIGQLKTDDRVLFGEEYPDGFVIILRNMWYLSMSYSETSYSDNRCRGNEPLDHAEKIEVAIFRPDQTWFIAEDMLVNDTTKPVSGVYGWYPCEKVLEVVAYIADMESQ